MSRSVAPKSAPVSRKRPVAPSNPTQNIILNFGSHGVLRTNSRVDQEKAMIATQLVANALISQTVADQTRAIQELKTEGYPFKLSDVKHLSPYLTRHLLRFGKFPVRCKTEPLPDNLGLDP
jgi:Tn3 transposase DDE domain